MAIFLFPGLMISNENCFTSPVFVLFFAFIHTNYFLFSFFIPEDLLPLKVLIMLP